MAKYDGLIIPRSYNDYINKSDPAGVSQALQLTGVMDNAPAAQSTKPAKSGGVFAANAVIMASSATLTGVAISAGSVVRVLFTAALTGSDATTGLTLTYNGNAYAVKVGKDGALVALTAHLIEESFVYLQAYTTLELAFDGSQFVVMGNPVVISNADFSIMADGSIAYSKNYIDGNTAIKVNTRDLDSLFMNMAGFSFVIENSSPENFAGLPTISDFDTAGGGLGVELIQFRTNARGYQLLTVNYYSTSGNWRTIIYGRTLIDSSIFPWHELHSYWV